MNWYSLFSLVIIPAFYGFSEAGLLLYLIYNGKRFRDQKSRILTFAFYGIIMSLLWYPPFGKLLGFYPISIIKYCLILLFIMYWARVSAKTACYYATIFFLITDLCGISIGMVSLKQYDINYLFEGADIGLRIFYNCAMFLTKATLIVPFQKLINHSEIHIERRGQVGLILLSMVPYLFLRDIGSWLPVQEEDIHYGILLILIVICICSLIIIIGNENIIFAHKKQNEIIKMEGILKNQHEQYLIRKEAMDLINMKYHDLKHILLGMEAMQDSGLIHRQIQEMLKEIEPFEAFQQTGNETLDIILTEKIRVCQENQIELISYTDGSDLCKLRPLDICAIFGNGLDNAIESSLKLPDIKKRHIYIKICRINNFLAAKIQNYYNHIVLDEAHNLLTTKKDENDHGYGISSIKRTVEKYQGEVNIEIENDKFTLTVLIPI